MRYINERFTFLLMWCLYTMWLMVYGSHKALKWWASTWADLHYMVFVPFESDLFRSVHECVARLMVGSGTGAQLTTEASLLLHTACCDQSRLFQTRLRVGVTLRWHHKASMVPHRMTLAIAATCYWVFSLLKILGNCSMCQRQRCVPVNYHNSLLLYYTALNNLPLGMNIGLLASALNTQGLEWGR